MAVIKNIQQFHAAIAAVCPIDGVGADGHIFFQASATPAQIAAANAAAAAYTDQAPQPLPIGSIIDLMTDAEYQLLHTFAQTHVAVHRLVFHGGQIDLTTAQATAFINALVAGGVLTQPRANVVFAPPPPPPPPPPVQAPPAPTPTTA